jgi:hypothetical protein
LTANQIPLLTKTTQNSSKAKHSRNRNARKSRSPTSLPNPTHRPISPASAPSPSAGSPDGRRPPRLLLSATSPRLCPSSLAGCRPPQRPHRPAQLRRRPLSNPLPTRLQSSLKPRRRETLILSGRRHAGRRRGSRGLGHARAEPPPALPPPRPRLTAPSGGCGPAGGAVQRRDHRRYESCLSPPDPNTHSPHSENKNHFFLVQATGGARPCAGCSGRTVYLGETNSSTCCCRFVAAVSFFFLESNQRYIGCHVLAAHRCKSRMCEDSVHVYL